MKCCSMHTANPGNFRIRIMKSLLSCWLLICLCLLCSRSVAQTQVLIIQDELPQMEVLADYLSRKGENTEIQIVGQDQLPGSMSAYDAVIVYIHRTLFEETENRIIEYTKRGGRLILLHHSISSGKAGNKKFFSFLGIRLDGADHPEDAELPGAGYAWVEPVTLTIVNLNERHYVTNHKISWSETIEYRPSDLGSDRQSFPSISFQESEVYLNHKFTDGREKTILLGLKYLDTRNNELFMQDRAGWYKKAGKGEIFYFMPGHSAKDFQHANYSQMILNAIQFSDKNPNI
jgi:hypothetical protein